MLHNDLSMMPSMQEREEGYLGDSRIRRKDLRVSMFECRNPKVGPYHI